jgi:hypothetical protein
MAHEAGHNLNMSHDFSANIPGTPRFDSTGANCTNIGGIMDYFQAITFMFTKDQSK